MEAFEDNYFEDEEKCGFLVPSMMKRVWAADQKVLSRVLEIGRAHNVQCFAAFGTLLGAVRHHGFVPWDDDMDIQVDRKDYMRFFRILRQELPEHYEVYSYYTGTPNKEPQGCIMNRKKPDLGSEPDREITEAFFGCPYVIGLDIFPLDYAPDEEEDRAFHKEVYSMVYDAAQRFKELTASGEMDGILPRLEELLGLTFSAQEDLEVQLWTLSDRIAMLYLGEGQRDYTDMKSLAMRKEGPYFPREWFSEAIHVRFEHMWIPVPIGYQGVLKTIYGNHYMEKRRFTATHEYPFYRKQELWRQKMLI